MTKNGVMYNNWVHSNQDHAHNTLLTHMYTTTPISCPL
jgi:hypothetical protein